MIYEMKIHDDEFEFREPFLMRGMGRRRLFIALLSLWFIACNTMSNNKSREHREMETEDTPSADTPSVDLVDQLVQDLTGRAAEEFAPQVLEGVQTELQRSPGLRQLLSQASSSAVDWSSIIAELQANAAVHSLFVCANHRDPMVRIASLRALAALRSKEILSPLLDLARVAADSPPVRGSEEATLHQLYLSVMIETLNTITGSSVEAKPDEELQPVLKRGISIWAH